MAIANRQRIGLSGVKYALLNETSDVAGGTPTYGTVYSLPGAITASFDPSSSATTLFADDGAYATAETVGEMAFTLNMADILPEDYSRLLGHTYSAGQVVENVSDQSPYVAFGFKILMNSSNTYEYRWLYKVKLTKPAIDANTKGASVEFQTPTMEGRAVKLADGNYRMSVRTDDTNASATLISGFFNQVTLPLSDVGALNVAIAEGTAGNAGKIQLTFSKTGGGNFVIVPATVTASNIIIGTASGAEAGAFSTPSATPAASQVIYFTPTVAFSSTEDVAVAVTDRVKDDNNVSCTQNVDVITIA